jgi:hypothetical protein
MTKPSELPDAEELVTVFQGSRSEALAIRAALADRGFETSIRDDAIKVVDPVVTGGYPLSVSLDAPAVHAEAILRWLAEDQPEGRPREITPDVELEKRLEALTLSITLSAILFLAAPIGLVLAARYGWLSRFSRGRPPHRAKVIWLSLACLVETAALLVAIGVIAV